MEKMQSELNQNIDKRKEKHKRAKKELKKANEDKCLIAGKLE